MRGGRPEDLNGAAQALFGVPGRSEALAALAPPSHPVGAVSPTSEYTLLTRALAGETDVHGELTVARPDGTHRTLSVAANGVYDAAGEIIGAVV